LIRSPNCGYAQFPEDDGNDWESRCWMKRRMLQHTLKLTTTWETNHGDVMTLSKRKFYRHWLAMCNAHSTTRFACGQTRLPLCLTLIP
jgi:hypothetical protein